MGCLHLFEFPLCSVLRFIFISLTIPIGLKFRWTIQHDSIRIVQEHLSVLLDVFSIRIQDVSHHVHCHRPQFQCPALTTIRGPPCLQMEIHLWTILVGNTHIVLHDSDNVPDKSLLAEDARSTDRLPKVNLTTESSYAEKLQPSNCVTPYHQIIDRK